MAKKSAKIHLLEPNKKQATLLKEEIGFVIPEATITLSDNPKSALQALQGGVDLLIVDPLDTKASDNRKAILSLLANFPKSNRPFGLLVITKDDSANNKNLVMELGADGFIPLPIDRHVIESKLETFFKGQYLSSLGFFGKPGGLGNARFDFSVDILSLGESEIKFWCPHHLAPQSECTLEIENSPIRIVVEKCSPLDGAKEKFEVFAKISPTSNQAEFLNFKKSVIGMGSD